MPDKFDPYREALVVETETVWSDEHDDMEPNEKLQLAQALHADAENADELEYIRMHTGFCRKITVTDDDLERVKG